MGATTGKGTRKPRRVLKDAPVSVYYTPEGKKLIERAALKADDSPGNWLRRISLAAARKVLGIADETDE
jgi:hypothetical protein